MLKEQWQQRDREREREKRNVDFDWNRHLLSHCIRSSALARVCCALIFVLLEHCLFPSAPVAGREREGERERGREAEARETICHRSAMHVNIQIELFIYLFTYACFFFREKKWCTVVAYVLVVLSSFSFCC